MLTVQDAEGSVDLSLTWVLVVRNMCPPKQKWDKILWSKEAILRRSIGLRDMRGVNPCFICTHEIEKGARLDPCPSQITPRLFSNGEVRAYLYTSIHCYSAYMLAYWVFKWWSFLFETIISSVSCSIHHPTWRYPYSIHAATSVSDGVFLHTHEQTPVCALPDQFWKNAKLFSAAGTIFKPKEKCRDRWSLNSMESVTVFNFWEHPEEIFIFFY